LLPLLAVAQVPQTKAEIVLSFAPIVKRTSPAVVNVYAKRIVRQRETGLMADPFFRRFFGEEGGFGRPRERVANSLGSGVIVDPRGLIVTNNHVIRDGDDIRVALADRREFEAKLLLADERTDLAVLKIDAGDEDLASLSLADSDDLEVGDLVLAIGNPFGVGQTVTSGIVSALARTQVGVTDYQFFIQTDAAINPGNSGGALVNMAGELVGINTAIYSRSGGSIGIGFSIPSNMVKVVVQSAEGGSSKIQRPWLGADLQDVTPDIAESLGFARPEGTLIVELHPKSPLAAAGLQRGDVITAIDGKDVEGARELGFRVGTAPKRASSNTGGDRIPLKQGWNSSPRPKQCRANRHPSRAIRRWPALLWQTSHPPLPRN
jgi:Do/DeqQ family serine protease